MERVKLSKEIASALDWLREEGYTNKMIMALELARYPNELETRIMKFFGQTSDCYDILMQALVVGWEVEQTPEDMVREYLNHLSSNGFHNAAVAVRETVKMLNLKIEGVNA